ncbi:MAG TPA: hypothetical protein VHI51_07270 [Ktedonobacterales bacterium]|jgi:hypothetical protein|nr:hypothetical protein [Ktedonobacterales bacterium]
MDKDESANRMPYKDTPEVVPSGKRMPIRDKDANTAASKRSRGARGTGRRYDEQRQGDTAPYDEVAKGQRNDDLEVQTARELAAREEEADDLAESLRQELRREERHSEGRYQIPTAPPAPSER